MCDDLCNLEHGLARGCFGPVIANGSFTSIPAVAGQHSRARWRRNLRSAVRYSPVPREGKARGKEPRSFFWTGRVGPNRAGARARSGVVLGNIGPVSSWGRRARGRSHLQGVSRRVRTRASLRRKLWSAGTETGEARRRATGLGLANLPQLGIEIFVPNGENGPGRASIQSLKDR